MDYNIYIDPYDKSFQGLPSLIVVISPLMKRNYEKYGDKIGIDATYKLVKDLNLNKTYKLVLMVG